MYTKKNGRVTFKSNRRPNYKRNNNYGSKTRNKGNDFSYFIFSFTFPPNSFKSKMNNSIK